MPLLSKIKTILIAVILYVSVITPVQVFAQADYNCDTYGSGAYQNNQCFVPGGGTTTSGGGRLTDTGRNILLFGGIGLTGAIGGAALFYFTVKRRRKDK